MIILRQREFSDQKWEKAAGHTVGAGINGAIAYKLGKDAVKKGIKNNKLAAAGAGIAATNAVYHTYKAGQATKEAKKK